MDGERNCSKLSSRVGRKAWQQAGRKRKSKEVARRRGSTEGTADRGKREEAKRKNGRLSSKNQNVNGRKKVNGREKP